MTSLRTLDGHSLTKTRRGVAVLASTLTGAMCLALVPTLGVAAAPVLLRVPYLTDTTGSSAIVNFATDTASPPAPVVTYGLTSAPTPCTGSSATASGTRVGLGSGISDYQFKAHLVGLSAFKNYCYTIVQNGSSLLSSAASFTSARSTGDSLPFSFAVIGDWGAGTVDEHNVLAQVKAAQPDFLLTVGDNAYPSGNQADYGDTVHGGHVFPTAYWPVLGSGLPAFPAQGNHGFTGYPAYLTNWPQDGTVGACAAQGCRYQEDPYPSYKGTTATNYASAWYAFDYGDARFYVLEAAWADLNIGSASSPYEVDYNQHWTTSSAEYKWLQADLATHGSTAHKFAFFHYPLHADTAADGTDSFLDGPTPDKLEGLLATNGVDVAFQGHAHIYERNVATVPNTSMVSYTEGSGGDVLGSLSACSAADAYALGAGGTHCGSAPAPASDQQVHSFLLVTVNTGAMSNGVTVQPIDENGGRFDAQTYAPPVTRGSISGQVMVTTTLNLGGTHGLLGAQIHCDCGQTVYSGSDGFYHINNVLAGSYTLTATDPYSASTPASIPVTVTAGTDSPGNNFSFASGSVFNPVGNMSGQVTDPARAAPNGIAGATITCSCGPSTTTDGNGNYVLNGAPSGTYTLGVHAPGYKSQQASVTVSGGGSATQNFMLVAGGSIAGRVTDSTTGAGIDGATVTCDCGGTTTYAPNGLYNISDVASGATANLTASAPGYITGQASLTVPTDGSTATQNLQLAPAPGSATGVVTDFTTKLPISGATVTCTCGSTTTSGSDGSYEMINIAPGTYDFSASAPLHDAVTAAGIVLGPGGQVEQDFALPQTPFGPPPGPGPGPLGGYWLVASDGGIFPFGSAGGFGSTGGTHLNQPIVGMASTPDNRGYWLVASDGGIFVFGDAAGYGSTGNIHLNKPIVGMAATPSGHGYWLVASDGGIFPFGDAVGHGSTGGIPLNKPIVGMAVTPRGAGYWLVASDGGIFPFGTAGGFGSTGGIHLNKPIVGMAATSDGRGYWLVASDGGIFPFGLAGGFGSTGGMPLNQPIVGMAATTDSGGYWLVASDGGIFPFGDAPGLGSTGNIHLNKPIVGMARIH